ncbi:MAG TPA: ABC transporter permease [Terracidiphilus sp.]|nr:ABC transporter permease [Terracidiphilus sp.]
MRLLDACRSRVSAIFLRSRTHDEMEQELRAHIQHRADDLEKTGISRAEAERQARVEFGGYEHFKEECHEQSGANVVDSLTHDLRYASRVLRKSPGFTMVAIMTLALGIGANAVVFSILNALVLRPVNVPQAQNLYVIQPASTGSSTESYPDYLDIRDRNRSFTAIAGYEMAPAGLNSDGTPAQIWLYEATGNYFDVLGVQPYLGRFFHASDEHGANSAPYLVLSYGYWKSHFFGNANVVGRRVRLNRFTYTVLGVAPPGFRGSELFFSPDIWAPLVDEQQVEGGSDLTSRGARGMWLVGNLKGGITPSQASADLNDLAASLAKEHPEDDAGMRLKLSRPGLLGDMLGGPVRAFVTGLMLLSALVLLAACANLGSLFAARAGDRGREVALRLALGSSRGRILRQLLTEAVLVSLGGSALGIVGAVALLRVISAWQPVPDIPINVPVNPDLRTYLAALVLALVSGLIFGLVPARQVLKADPYQGMKMGSQTGARSERISLRDILLALEIAVCAVLVTASLVAVRGMVRSLHSNFGFVPIHAMQVCTDVDMGGHHGEDAAILQRRILEAVKGIPGVSAAGYTNRVPLNLGWSDNTVFKDSATDYKISNAAADAMEYNVSPGYLGAAETTLIAGRDLTWNDTKDAPRVAVVNQEFARRLFGSEANAIGSHFKIWNGVRVLVIGVVEDGKYKTLSEDPQPAMFLSILQSPSSETFLIVRSDRGTAEITAALERNLRALNTGLPFSISTWSRELNTALFSARAASMALGVLGVLGAMLAITGIFGLAAYSVSKRLRELGIRIALGAKRREVLSAALGRVIRLLAAGSAVGLVLGLAATKLLSFIVYQASPRDPAVLGGVIFCMTLVGLMAAWIPAQRALGADPLVLLREE